MSSTTLSIIHANLAIKCFNKLIENETSQSIIYSPISLAIALSMAYLGSNGKTKEEIKSFLVGENNDEELHQHFNEFLNDLTKNEDSLLQSVNKIYVKENFSLLESFTEDIKKYYEGQFEQVDFNSPNTCDIINNFVQKATNDIIQNLISPSDLNDLTRLILINAIYFKGKWCLKFDKNLTKEDDFYITQNTTKKVDMMFKKDKYKYYENEEYQLIQLEYEGDKQRMIILLPKERNTLKERLQTLDGNTLFDLIDSTDKLPVHVYLPKFKVESMHQLNETLSNLGMKLPFSDYADFSLMTDEEPLQISKIIQKAFVEVDEEGTEAAAATAVIMMCRSSLPHKPTPNYVFRADHPFAYFIMDNHENILFTGIYQ
ncbi:Serpin domain-containing protein [Strongyloides ratti]|uniref:Serpin domain-containing protein n=1 Tax=Strongyloides ratti TaxID=34506 RepID=A0A090L4K3_STRRB|nr:Serpin domain-containing protein [Strongyloides ratti]CEF64647.1 Serpin domain-containing protein [Strongyloides ratti]